ncbi:MAG: nucleotidyl transferase AbiEii/AbiGii toxin family protein [Pirellulales bacterium]
MTPLLAAGLELQSFFEARNWKFCVIGGLAVHRWGNPRATQDVDLTLLTEFGKEESYVDEILAHFEPRRPDSRQLALVARVLLINASNKVPVDVALGALQFEVQAVQRATPYEFAPGCTLMTLSAEDLIISKAFSNRDRDWVDVHDVILLQGKKVNWRYIDKQLAALCELKEDNEPVSRLADLRAKFAATKPRLRRGTKD